MQWSTVICSSGYATKNRSFTYLCRKVLWDAPVELGSRSFVTSASVLVYCDLTEALHELGYWPTCTGIVYWHSANAQDRLLKTVIKDYSSTVISDSWLYYAMNRALVYLHQRLNNASYFHTSSCPSPVTQRNFYSCWTCVVFCMMLIHWTNLSAFLLQY